MTKENNNIECKSDIQHLFNIFLCIGRSIDAVVLLASRLSSYRRVFATDATHTNLLLLIQRYASVQRITAVKAWL